MSPPRPQGLPFLVGCRLRLEDGAEWLAWPGCRASYGRLTALLSRSRMQSAKGEASIGREAMLAAAEGWALAVVPPADDRPGLRRAPAAGCRGAARPARPAAAPRRQPWLPGQ